MAPLRSKTSISCGLGQLLLQIAAQNFSLQFPLAPREHFLPLGSTVPGHGRVIGCNGCF